MTTPKHPPAKAKPKRRPSPNQPRGRVVRAWAYTFRSSDGTPWADAGSYRECRHAIKVRTEHGVICSKLVRITLPAPLPAGRKGRIK